MDAQRGLDDHETRTTRPIFLVLNVGLMESQTLIHFTAHLGGSYNLQSSERLDERRPGL